MNNAALLHQKSPSQQLRSRRSPSPIHQKSNSKSSQLSNIYNRSLKLANDHSHQQQMSSQKQSQPKSFVQSQMRKLEQINPSKIQERQKEQNKSKNSQQNQSNYNSNEPTPIHREYNAPNSNQPRLVIQQNQNQFQHYSQQQREQQPEKNYAKAQIGFNPTYTGLAAGFQNSQVPYVSDKEQQSYLRPNSHIFQKQESDSTLNHNKKEINHLEARSNLINPDSNNINSILNEMQETIFSEQQQIHLFQNSQAPNRQGSSNQKTPPHQQNYSSFISRALPRDDQKISNQNLRVQHEGRSSNSQAQINQMYLRQQSQKSNENQERYERRGGDDATNDLSEQSSQGQPNLPIDSIQVAEDAPNYNIANTQQTSQRLRNARVKNGSSGHLSPEQQINNPVQLREQLQNASKKVQNSYSDILPVGSYESLLFITKLIQNERLNIRIPETIIGQKYSETKLFSNEPLSSSSQKSKRFRGQNPLNNDEDGNLFSIQKQALLQLNPISSIKLSYNLLEEKVCEWLQLNLEKSKTGKFVPVSVKKIKSKQTQKQQIHLDFFVVSTLQSYNNGFKQIKNNNKGEDLFFIQRYIPTQGEYNQVYRGLWKKSQGYKFYLLESNYPYNGDKTQVRNRNSASAALNSQQQSSSNDHRELTGDKQVNLIYFDDLSGQFSDTAKLTFEELSSFLVEKDVIPRHNQNEFSNPKFAKIDFGSKKNLQHLMLQYKIETEQKTFHPQFLILDKDQKTYLQTKVRSQDDETHLIVSQIQNQMNELIRVIQERVLQSEGLELQRITADFVQDYTDKKVYFIQIKSFHIEQIPQNPNQHLQIDLNNHRRNLTSGDLQNNNQKRFNCHGDYCYIQDQNLVPKHLAPIIAKLLNHEHLKVSKQTIQLERENIMDNYRAYNKSSKMFDTLNQQELLLRKSLEEDEDQDVCPTCFHVYKYLQEFYYSQKFNEQDQRENFYTQQPNSTQQILTNNMYSHHHPTTKFPKDSQQQHQQLIDGSFQLQYQPRGKTQMQRNQVFSYNLYNGGEVIKEDTFEEEYQDSKRDYYQPDQALIIGRSSREEYQYQVEGNEMEEDQGEFERENEQEQEFYQDTKESYSQRENIQQLQTYDRGLQERSQRGPHFGNNQEFSNSPDELDRDSQFKVPSEMNYNEHKPTFISQTEEQAFPHNQRQASSKVVFGQSPLSLQQKRPSQGQSVLLVQERTDNESDEFNPKPKYHIKSRTSQQLTKMRTSHFGKDFDKSKLEETKQSIKIETQTFSIAQIVNKKIGFVERKRSLSINASKEFQIQIRPQSDLRQYEQLTNQPTLQNLPLTENARTPENMIRPNSTVKNQTTSFRTSFSKDFRKNESFVHQKQEIKSRNIDIQVGESLALSKPPLATPNKSNLNQFSQKNTLESQLSNQVEKAKPYLDKREQLKNLTQQNSFNTSKISQVTPQKSETLRKSIQKKNNSDQVYTQAGEFKLPPLNAEEEEKVVDKSQKDQSVNQLRKTPTVLLKKVTTIQKSIDGTPKSQRSLLSQVSRNSALKDKQFSFKSDKKQPLLPPNQTIELPPLVSIQNSEEYQQNSEMQVNTSMPIKDSFVPTSSQPSSLQNIQNSEGENQMDQEPSRNVSDENKSKTMLQIFRSTNDPLKQSISGEIPQETYEAILPKSPPRLLLDSSPLLQSLPKKLQMSIASRQDSFFGGQTKSIDEDYLIDYIISNEDGEMSSIINSNPHLKSIIQNRKSMLALQEQSSFNKALTYKNNTAHTQQMQQMSILQNGVSLGSIEEADKRSD